VNVTERHRSRILIVDDSAVIRRLLATSLGADPEIEVVAEAADVFTANELIAVHRPDVVTLDLEMPRMDGLAFLRHLMKHNPTAVIVVSSFTPAGSAASLEALHAGAVDVIPKPQNPQAVASFAVRLRRRIRDLRTCALHLRPIATDDGTDRARRSASTLGRAPQAIVAIGASTGGPPAVERVLAAMPADSPPILIVQHMPANFTRLFAKHLDETSTITVVEATHQQPLKAGTAYLAPGDHHLTVGQHEGTLRAVLRRGPLVHRQRPSVDVLFESAAAVMGPAVLGVVLTGMGSDGVEGARAIARAGGRTLTESEATCVVYGMPRAVKEAGLSVGEARIEDMPAAIVSRL